jgi:hypothetical protein
MMDSEELKRSILQRQEEGVELLEGAGGTISKEEGLAHLTRQIGMCRDMMLLTDDPKEQQGLQSLLRDMENMKKRYLD